MGFILPWSLFWRWGKYAPCGRCRNARQGTLPADRWAHRRRNAPEKAVQQVDAPAQIELELAVIPEHGLHHVAQKRPDDKQPQQVCRAEEVGFPLLHCRGLPPGGHRKMLFATGFHGVGDQFPHLLTAAERRNACIAEHGDEVATVVADEKSSTHIEILPENVFCVSCVYMITVLSFDFRDRVTEGRIILSDKLEVVNTCFPKFFCHIMYS